MGVLTSVPAGQDESSPWIIWAYYAALVIAASFLVSYLRRYYSGEQARLLARSLMFYQVSFSVAVVFAVNVGYPAPGEDQQVIPSNLIASMLILYSMLSDAVHTSRCESLFGVFTTTVCMSYSLFMGVFVWYDTVVYQGDRYNNATGLFDGSWTKQEIRRLSLSSTLLLLFGSIKDSVKDSKHERLLFVKIGRIKRDVQRGLEDGTHQPRTTVHWSMRAILTCCAIFAVCSAYYGLNRAPDAESTGFLLLLLSLIMCVVVAMAIYGHTFFVHERVKEMVSSLLAWQVMILMAIPFVLTVHLSSINNNNRQQQALAGGVLMLLASFTTLLLDCCNSSKYETVLFLSLLAVNLIAGLCSCIFLLEDSPVFTGIGQKKYGACTKLEILRSTYTSMLCLTVNSFKDAFFDGDNKRFFLVRDGRLKPSRILSKWRKACQQIVGSGKSNGAAPRSLSPQMHSSALFEVEC
jgi:hypothetical protein